MRVSILVPSDEYRNYAGARIRYGRLQPPLAQLGVNLQLEDVANFMPDQAGCDVLLISKCHDARSLIAAAGVSKRKKLVGVDLFDDYFSQFADARLFGFRNWLNQLLPICNFALCSTEAMAKVTAMYRRDLPVHVLNDPAEPVADLSAILEAKLACALDERKIHLCWFGIGDNPYFKVGLSDLAAHGGILQSLQRSGMDIELNVLTNARALDSQGLALINRLPFRASIQEWSEDRERDHLSKAFACFLPVSAQAFSVAKSLNRAITALSAGCQAISVGYPLYEPLDSFIYRDPASFLSDLTRRQMRHSAQTAGKFASVLQGLASPAGEARAFVNFLEGLASPTVGSSRNVVLVHGHEANGAAHRLVHSIHGYSAASPYCITELEFDVIFRGQWGQPVMLVSQKVAGRVRPEVRTRLRESKFFGNGRYWEVLDDNVEAIHGSSASAWHEAPVPLRVATYGRSVDEMRSRIEQVFGPSRTIISESSPIPFYSETVSSTS